MRKIILSLITSFSFLVIAGCDNLNIPVSTKSPSPTSETPKQTETVLIEGIVEDPTGKPVEGVKIVVKEDDKILGQTISNAKGEFSIKVPKTFGDSYFVDASKSLPDGSLNQTLLIRTGQKANFIGEDKLKKTEVAAKPVPAP